jgi:hypothetical protein
MITVAFIEEDSGGFDGFAFTGEIADTRRDGFGTSTRLALTDAPDARRTVALRERVAELP